jgi:acyl-coenzyme A synthetase/AMP-(fatty) acid ligase
VTLVPVNTAFRVEEARYPVEHAGARVLVTGAAGFEVAREVYQRAAGLRELVVVGRGARIQADRRVAQGKLRDLWVRAAPRQRALQSLQR